MVYKFLHYVLEVSTYTNIVYIGMYLVLTYIEIFFQHFAAILALFVGQ